MDPLTVNKMNKIKISEFKKKRSGSEPEEAEGMQGYRAQKCRLSQVSPKETEYIKRYKKH